MTKLILILAVMINTVIMSSAYANSFFDQFLDPTDGQFDTSDWLLNNSGVLPVPIIITEPAVGTGLGMAAVFFHDSTSGTDTPLTDEKKAKLPPSLSVLFGGKTENGTWFAGGAHRGIWRNDHIRYMGALARVSVNLSFYGTGDNTRDDDDGLDFSGDGVFLLQEMKFRIEDSSFFVGARFNHMDFDISFDDVNEVPGVSDDNLGNTKASGLGIIGSYDSRDNTFTPNSGTNTEIEAMFYSASMLGDFSYEKYKLANQTYWNFNAKWILGWRLEGQFSSGDIPFYSKPYIDLRGIPAMRYQGDDVILTELELRWNINNRWSAVGFTGVGRAEDKRSNLFNSDGETHSTVGVGGRYLMARKMGLYTGFDVARGPDETVFYLQVGSAWQ